MESGHLGKIQDQGFSIVSVDWYTWVSFVALILGGSFTSKCSLQVHFLTATQIWEHKLRNGILACWVQNSIPCFKAIPVVWGKQKEFSLLENTWREVPTKISCRRLKLRIRSLIILGSAGSCTSRAKVFEWLPNSEGNWSSMLC